MRGERPAEPAAAAAGAPRRSSRAVRYALTEKGKHALPVLAARMSFAFRRHTDELFADGRPRTMAQVMPVAGAQLLRGLAGYGCRHAPARR